MHEAREGSGEPPPHSRGMSKRDRAKEPQQGEENDPSLRMAKKSQKVVRVVDEEPSPEMPVEQPQPPNPKAKTRASTAPQRVFVACRECHRSHTKCSNSVPCERCVNLNLECVSGGRRGKQKQDIPNDSNARVLLPSSQPHINLPRAGIPEHLPPYPEYVNPFSPPDIHPPAQMIAQPPHLSFPGAMYHFPTVVSMPLPQYPPPYFHHRDPAHFVPAPMSFPVWHGAMHYPPPYDSYFPGNLSSASAPPPWDPSSADPSRSSFR